MHSHVKQFTGSMPREYHVFPVPRFRSSALDLLANEHHGHQISLASAPWRVLSYPRTGVTF